MALFTVPCLCRTQSLEGLLSQIIFLKTIAHPRGSGHRSGDPGGTGTWRPELLVPFTACCRINQVSVRLQSGCNQSYAASTWKFHLMNL